MCGICGVYNFDGRPADQRSVQQMMRPMKHRGPDDEGVFSEENVALGHVRLSILDLSAAGRQPMLSHDGRYVIVYNGEIYNYIELREQLKSSYRFSTGTDTEVLLAAFQEWGLDCLDKFNGMWAFVIYDRREKSLYAARDRFGIKPFYYYVDSKRFVFASEIPPILSLMDQVAPHDRAVFDYFVYNRTDQEASTFFRDIQKLQHGHLLSIRQGQLQAAKWYDLTSQIGGGFTQPEEFREAFSSAVGLRLRSDVPVGVCLSGGVDSSSITSILLHDYHKSDLHTFSAVYGSGVRGDESEFMQAYSDSIKNQFFCFPTADTLHADLDRFVAAHGEPTPTTGPYAQFKVMELARNHVGVTLDGQGADEQLGGYHYFYGYYFKSLFLQLNLFRLLREMMYYIGLQKSTYAFQTFLYYLLPGFLKSRLRIREKGYLIKDFSAHFEDGGTIVAALYDAGTLRDALLRHFQYKLEHLLKWEDRNSMRFSIEARVPFLDYRLVENTLAMRPDLAIRNGVTKYMLREAMRGILPEQIRTRHDKVGFLTPEDEWFRQPKFRELIYGLLQSRTFRERGYVDARQALLLYERHLRGEINISKEIWKWINLELWFRTFVDAKS